MKNLNTKTYFLSNLRPSPENISDYIKHVDFLENTLLKLEQKNEKAKLFSEIGFKKAILENYLDAINYLEKAIKIFEELNLEKNLIVAKIRLATTFQWAKNFEKANKLFDLILEEINKNTNLIDYKDFAYQHRGKNFFDQFFYEKALDDFEKALEIRNLKNDSELISSTILAINTTKAFIN
ncbi:MAG: tetratricopeptide repeat protein [Candidatus Sericytochromatia bacterium]